MKNRLISMLLLFCFCFSLFACNTPEEEPAKKVPKDIVEKIMFTMEEVSTVRADAKVSMVMMVGGMEMCVNGTAEIVYASENPDDLYFYSYSRTTIDYGETETKYATREGYNEGTFFYSYTEGDDSKSWRSSQSIEDFVSYYVSQNLSAELTDYGKFEHTESEEDGSHTVVLSSYKDATITELNERLGLPVEVDGTKIIDLKVTIKANAECLLEEVVTEYIFSDETSVGKQTMTISGYDGVERKTLYLNPDDYSSVQDASAIPTLISLLSERKNEKNTSFNYEGFYKVSAEENYDSHQERDQVRYGVDAEGDYYFEIDSTVDGTPRKLEYKDGVYTVDGKEDATLQFNDITAKRFSGQLIDPYSISAFSLEQHNTIASINEADGVTTYEILLDSEMSPFENTIASYNRQFGTKPKQTTNLMVIQVKDNAILSISYRFVLEYEIWVRVGYSGKYVHAEVENRVKITFDDTEG